MHNGSSNNITTTYNFLFDFSTNVIFLNIYAFAID